MITENIKLYCKFPTLQRKMIPQHKEQDHSINLIKKNVLRGILIYKFKWSLCFDRRYRAHELSTVPGLLILELKDLKRTQAVIDEMMKFRAEHNTFKLEEILRNIKLSTSTSSLSQYNGWLTDPIIDQFSEQERGKSVHQNKIFTLYKGKKKQ